MRGTSCTPHDLSQAVLLIAVSGRPVEQQIYNYAEDQGTCNFSQRDSTDIKCHATDTGNQNDRGSEKIPVIVQINGLQHFQAGYRDKTVKSDAYTAHHTGRDRAEEGHKRGKETCSDCQDCRGENCYDGSVAGNGHASDRFTVGCIRASAEKCAGHGTHAVTQQRAVETGLFKQILPDYRGQISVIRNVLRKDDEGDWDISHGDCADVCTEFREVAAIREGLECFDD